MSDQVRNLPNAFAHLQAQFNRMERQLHPLRDHAVAGLTALRSRLEQLTVAALAADSAARYLVVNAAAAALTGYEQPELERMSVWDLTPLPDLRTGERLWAAFLDIKEQQGTYSLHGKHNIIEHVCYYARAHVLPNVHVSLLCRVRSMPPGAAERGE